MADGFRPARHLNGSNCFRSTTYTVNANNPKALFAGHAVVLSSGNVVEATAAGGSPVIGVIKAMYTGTKNKPKTFSLPDGTNYVPASTAAFVDVYDDPDIIFSVVADSAANVGSIGQVGDITASASGNNTLGRSNMQLDTSGFAAETSANSETKPFKIVRLAATELDGYADGQRLEVLINNHALRPNR